MNDELEVERRNLSTAEIVAAEYDAPRMHIDVEPSQALQQESGTPAPLFSQGEAQEFRTRWTTVQAGFVDEPRQAVQRADALVSESMKRLAEVFTEEHSKLEHEWDRGGDVSTEDLRVALRRYRSFFDRLLSV